MRDSNSRGLAHNTLSKSAGVCSFMTAMVRDLRRGGAGGMAWMPLNSGE
jgi:hypothetical protein